MKKKLRISGVKEAWQFILEELLKVHWQKAYSVGGKQS